MVPKLCSIDGCDRQYKARGYCSLHYKRWWVSTPALERLPLPPEERFWAKVKRGAPDDCWEWQGPPCSLGYGVFNMSTGKSERTHRISLQLKLGRPLLPGAYACHTCDNRRCVNPAHLYEGNNQTNVSDAVNRGRNSKGEALSTCGLTDGDVLKIRLLAASGEKNRTIADHFGLTESNVSAITRGKSWAHVGGPRTFKLIHKQKRKKAA